MNLKIRLAKESLVRFRSSKSKEEGTVMLEFAATIGFLVLLFMALISLSTMLVAYMKISQIIDEGIRTLSSVPRLSAEVVEGPVSGSIINACAESPIAFPKCGHVLAQRRVQFLLNSIEIKSIDRVNLRIRTEYTGVPEKEGQTGDTVRMIITVPYTGIVPLFDGLELDVEGEGPYLFASNE